MARKYTSIKEHEKEIIEMREKGMTKQEIADKLRFTKKQIKDFINRYNRKQRQTAEEISLKRMGRPLKDDKYTKTDKVSELRYIIARKDAKIKVLEMENELMRDFLSLTGRK